MITITETITIEDKKHEDGFEYSVHCRSSSEGHKDAWATIRSACNGSYMRVEDAPSNKAKLNGKYYRFDGESVVCVGVDPTNEEMRKRIGDLIHKFVTKGVHAFLEELDCNECGHMIYATCLFSPAKGLLKIGCEDAFRFIEEFAIMSPAGKIEGPSAYFGDEYLNSIVQSYISDVDEIEEWVNAE